jgi:class 3 adenylate cyclase
MSIRTKAALVIAVSVVVPPGFTPFAESRAPESLMDALNQTFSKLTEVVFKHHGALT